jgi:ATP-dependent HslUV protease ATP-binding subunit HslU
VKELDKYIIGQDEAKRAVAIAIRNRWRRLRLGQEMREEVLPKNIIMIGPTGVGKTEIARRLAQLVDAPFIKVEASKYTEVGYHGRDVESMVRELVDISVGMRRQRALREVEKKAEASAQERLLDLLIPPPKPSGLENPPASEHYGETREKFRKKLEAGELEERTVELVVEEKIVPVQVLGGMGLEQMDVDFQQIMEKILPTRSHERKLKVKDARRIITQQEAEHLIDKDKVTRDAVHDAENSGIIFLDELDKIASRGSEHGPDVSRQGVQRDLLPIVEGSTVATRYGYVRTDHILFIGAGAFHMTSPADLIPEIQGRFPIRVELGDLGKDEFVRILTEPKNALTKQYQALLKTERIRLKFTPDAVEAIAEIAVEVNSRAQNIGARRLQTVMEKLLEDLSFDAAGLKRKTFTINAAYVQEKLAPIIKDEDLSRYIL